MRSVFSEAMRSSRGPDCFETASRVAAGMRSAVWLWTGQNTERNAMGLKHGNEPQYTMWTHTENGKVVNRRLHKMDVQDRFGRMHHLKEDELPEAIHTFSGQAYTGAHLATILLRPEKLRVPQAAPPDTAAWPCLRDVANFFIGFMSITILRVIIALIEAL
jgi:hypothetical protein